MYTEVYMDVSFILENPYMTLVGLWFQYIIFWQPEKNKIIIIIWLSVHNTSNIKEC